MLGELLEAFVWAITTEVIPGVAVLWRRGLPQQLRWVRRGAITLFTASLGCWLVMLGMPDGVRMRLALFIAGLVCLAAAVGATTFLAVVYRRKARAGKGAAEEKR